MTPNRYNLRRAYEWARNNAPEESLPRRCAEMADAAYEAMNDMAKQSAWTGDPIRVDRADLAEEFVTTAFRFACESNGVEWQGFGF